MEDTIYVCNRLPLPHEHWVGPGFFPCGWSNGRVMGRGSKTPLSLPRVEDTSLQPVNQLGKLHFFNQILRNQHIILLSLSCNQYLIFKCYLSTNWADECCNDNTEGLHYASSLQLLAKLLNNSCKNRFSYIHSHSFHSHFLNQKRTNWTNFLKKETWHTQTQISGNFSQHDIAFLMKLVYAQVIC